MSRGQITKDHFKILILQQKNRLQHESRSDECKLFAQKQLNEILDKLEEFRY